MKKYTIIFFLLFLIFLSCNTKDKLEVLNEKIEKSLSLNQDVENIFLNLNFGMSIQDFENHLKKTTAIGKTYNENIEYFYEFTENEKLKGIDWNISPKLHNDSLIGIKLHSFKKLWRNNNNTINQTFSQIIIEFKSKYGEPDFIANNFEYYWIENNVLLTISKSEIDDLGGTVYINYENKRKEKSIDLQKCSFDDRGNSLDLWYAKFKIENEKVINKDL